MSPDVISDAAAAVMFELLEPFEAETPWRAYALVDAARDERIFASLRLADCELVSLYRGAAAEKLATTAPYLIRLEADSWFTPWLLETAWGHSWGLFMSSTATLDQLRSHFRRLIMVRMPDGAVVYFRFYDPRVFRVLLPTCLPEELRTIFGPVARFVIESAEGDEAIRFVLSEGALTESRTRVRQAPAC